VNGPVFRLKCNTRLSTRKAENGLAITTIRWFRFQSMSSPINKMACYLSASLDPGPFLPDHYALRETAINGNNRSQSWKPFCGVLNDTWVESTTRQMSVDFSTSLYVIAWQRGLRAPRHTVSTSADTSCRQICGNLSAIENTFITSMGPTWLLICLYLIGRTPSSLGPTGLHPDRCILQGMITVVVIEMHMLTA
jgi:hypothetical protein